MSCDTKAGSLPIAHKARLDVMPGGDLAMEIGDLDAVLILTPTHARRLASRMRTLLCGDSVEDLLAERRRIDAALAYKRKQRGARGKRG